MIRRKAVGFLNHRTLNRAHEGYENRGLVSFPCSLSLFHSLSKWLGFIFSLWLHSYPACDSQEPVCLEFRLTSRIKISFCPSKSNIFLSFIHIKDNLILR